MPNQGNGTRAAMIKTIPPAGTCRVDCLTCLRNRDALRDARPDRHLEGSDAVRHALVGDEQNRVVVLQTNSPEKAERGGEKEGPGGRDGKGTIPKE